jgi:hypothetical protein
MNKDHCEENPSCPVQLGRQILEAKIDASAVFTKYLGLFYGNDVRTSDAISLVFVR